MKDHDNNLIAVGESVIFNLNNPMRKWGYVVKFDSDLNMLWDKHFQEQSAGSDNGIMSVACDSQNNIYCSGSFRKSFAFGGTTLQQHLPDAPESTKFICKLLPDSTEDWIVDLSDYSVVGLQMDASDKIYALASYTKSLPVSFPNTTVNDLPVVEDEELALFKIDVNRNLIWSVPIYGSGVQEVANFTCNSMGKYSFL
ncbi:hypothetical protein [Flavobacterium sp. 3HN19-14]|uniref:hypothetical protein n=1 Tax=Flavobacterium sp. 3HN19-14 TaxID=3448133 RepID=UPI003EE37D49